MMGAVVQPPNVSTLDYMARSDEQRKTLREECMAEVEAWIKANLHSVPPTGKASLRPRTAGFRARKPTGLGSAALPSVR